MTFAIDATHDTANLTMTVVAQLDATPERVWQLWADPRQLERWWGPPTYPATFTQHDLVVGSTTAYHMTSPEGDTMPGWWVITAVDEPRSLELRDGFAEGDGTPDETMPITSMRMTLEPADGGTRMTLVSHFDSLEGMEKLIAMGMKEGMTLAMGQIEAILAN